MSDLFLAGVNRLWRSRVFQICCLVSFVANVFVMLATYRQVLNYTELGLEQSITLDNVFYGLVPVLYLANYAVCLVAAFAFLVCWFLGGLAGVPLIGAWRDVNGLLLSCAVLVLCAASYMGIFCLLSMLCANRAAAAVVALLLSVALLMFSSYMLSALNEPEFQQGMMMTEAGLELSEPMPNPSYVGGMKREVFRFLSDTLPSGQSISVCSYERAGTARVLAGLVRGNRPADHCRGRRLLPAQGHTLDIRKRRPPPYHTSGGPTCCPGCSVERCFCCLSQPVSGCGRSGVRSAS